MINEIKDGWMVEIPPLFFEDEYAARAFVNQYGGFITKSKRVVKAKGGEFKPFFKSVDSGLTESDFAN